MPLKTLAFTRYPVNSFSTTIADDITDIYYPVATDETFPMAVFITGALVEIDNYTGFAQELASYGFVVSTSNDRQVLPAFDFDGQLPQASQITNTLAYLQAENTNPTSPLQGIIDTETLGVVGHSHGGGVALTATEGSCLFPFCSGTFDRPEEFQATVGYGTHRFNPFSMEFEATNNQGIPVALIQGSLDGIATPDEAEGTFELIQSSPKALITINGANHFSINNVNNPPGATVDPLDPTLTQTEGNEAIAQWTAIFLLTHLENNPEAYELIYNSQDDDPLVTIEAQAVPEPSTIGSLLLFLILLGLSKVSNLPFCLKL